MKMVFYKLTYFANVRGRAELIRLVFAAAGVKYTDNRIERDKWRYLKPSTPQGKLPILEVDDIVLPQSLAIARYLAKEFGLFGRTNLEQAQADVVVQTCDDVRSSWATGFGNKNEEERAEILKQFAAEAVPKFLPILERILLSNSGGNGFYIGDSVTIADLAVYEALEVVDQFYPNMLGKFSKLKANRDRVAELPRVKAYLESRPITYF